MRCIIRSGICEGRGAPVMSEALIEHGERLSRLVWRFNFAVDRALIRYREEIIDRQYVQDRIANIAMQIFASACVLSRWDANLQAGIKPDDGAAALFLRESSRRVRRLLAELRDND